jgi:dipeptidyl aminopeptidase/acylaminoacyl peptidase
MHWTPDGRSLLVKVMPEGASFAELEALLPTSGSSEEPAPAPGRVTARTYVHTPATRADSAVSAGPGDLVDLDASRSFLNVQLGDLAIVDVATGKATRIARRVRAIGYRLSPAGDRVAFTTRQPDAGIGRLVYDRYDLWVARVSGALPRLLAPRTIQEYGLSFSWSPDGESIAYTSGGDISVIRAADGVVVHTFTRDGVAFEDEYRAPLWADDHTLLLAAADTLWRVSLAAGTVTRVASPRERRLDDIVAPADAQRIDGPYLLVAVSDPRTKRRGFHRVHLDTGEATPLHEDDITLGSLFRVSRSRDGANIAFVSGDASSPPDIRVADGEFTHVRRLTDLNPAVSRLPLGGSRLVEWADEAGRRLQGALLLPAGYRPGTRYPLVVEVYGGSMRSGLVNRFGAHEGLYNLQLLASRGYAVLLPDAPTGTGSPMADIAAAVLPGIDAVIEMGVADADRVAVMGHSYGGYSALALGVQSPRFRTVISSAGFSNLLTQYAVMRDDGSAVGVGWSERGQGRMGGHPWDHLDRYRDNSPFFFLDRVQAPVLLLHGGRDHIVAPEASRETFVALRRLDREAMLVEYAGEGHSPQDWSLANATDYWARIFDWLERHLTPRVTSGAGAPTNSANRPMEPEDLFRIEQIRSIAWSPDGQHVALGLTPELRVLKGSVPHGNLSILHVGTRSLHRLQVPEDRMIGAWNPVWSPDGRRLAFLVIGEDAVISPWVWQIDTPTPTRIADIDVRVSWGDAPLVWRDSTTLNVIAWSPGARKGGSLVADVVRGQHVAALRTRAREGHEASVTVLDPGGTLAEPAPVAVLAVDVTTGAMRTLLRGRPHRLLLSPDGRRLAYFTAHPARQATSVFEHDELYDAVNWGEDLHILDLVTGRAMVDGVGIVSAGYESMSWSNDGRLVVPGRLRGAPGSGLIVVDDGVVATADVTGLAALDAGSVRWLDHRLLVRGQARAGDRRDWWLLEPGGPRNLTVALPGAPPTLVALPDGTLVGAGGGQAWRISTSAAPVRLTPAIDVAITSIAALDPARGLLTGTVDGRRAILRMHADSLSVAEVDPPRPGAGLRTLSPAGDAALFTRTGDDGTVLWIAGGGGRPFTDAATVWHGNRWVSEVSRGEERFIRYHSTEGESFGGWLLLPPDYTPGDRVPLVVQVYPGSTQREGASPFSVLENFYLNAHLFAARGYGVLVPSMPSVETLAPTQRLPSLAVGVLPALDTLIARGIADGDRLAVFGYSYGGYATLGLIGQTNRFRAAMAFSSLTNLASVYGTFYGDRRYGDGGDPQDGQLLRMLQLERGYGGMGTTPWESPQDYVDASPLFLAGRVETPVMLVHGDLDFVPIQQAEEYFTALYRQDKRVRLLSYHGEGHGLSTRANVLDVWQRIGEWLDELLGSQDGGAVGKGATLSP